MRIFLGNAPWRKGNRYGVRAGSRWPHWQQPGSVYLPFPFYLAYATAVLEQAGFECKLVDGIAEHLTEHEFIDRIIQFNPDMVVLETSTPTIEVDLAIAKKIAKVIRKTKAKRWLVFVGPHVSVMPEDIMNKAEYIDFILVGEYEYTLRELVQKLAKHESIAPVTGIVYRTEDNRIVRNPRRALIENIDELPWPAYHHLPMLNYNDDFGVLPKPMVQMWASRGCPFQCNFCLWPQVVYGSNRYRVRDPVKVVDELEWLIKTYGFKSVYFDDDTFDLGKQRILHFCSELNRRGIKIPWAAMARADTLDQEMLQAMANAGMIAIKYGVESGVQELIDRCGKRLDLNKVVETVKITKSVGIKVHLTFTFGLEGETKETIQKTIDFALSLEPDSVQFSIVTPFPGTKYYYELKEKGYLLATRWSDFDGNRSAVIRTEYLTSEDLIDALHRAYNAWYQYRDKRVQATPISIRPIPLLEHYKPTQKKEKVLVINYTDLSVAFHAADILHNQANAGEIHLLTPKKIEKSSDIANNFTIVRTIQQHSGYKKLLLAIHLLRQIRTEKYDLVVLLSDNANSYLRRFPLTLTYLSGAKHIIVTDPNCCGYMVVHPLAYIIKMVKYWLTNR
ncbi:MAG: cobalamin-dependent protein [bacterium]|nr:cobalamin-dependent protein [bacterium]